MGPEGHGSTESSAAERIKGPPELVCTFWHLLALFCTIPAARAGSAKDRGKGGHRTTGFKTAPKSVQFSAGWQPVVKNSHTLYLFFTISIPQQRVMVVNPRSAVPVLNLAHEARAGPPLGAEFDKAQNSFLVVHIRSFQAGCRGEGRNPTRRSPTSGAVQGMWPWTLLLSTELLFGPRFRVSDRTPPHRERTKASLEAATEPDPGAPPADRREHRPRPAVFLPANPHRTAV